MNREKLDKIIVALECISTTVFPVKETQRCASCIAHRYRAVDDGSMRVIFQCNGNFVAAEALKAIVELRDECERNVNHIPDTTDYTTLEVMRLIADTIADNLQSCCETNDQQHAVLLIENRLLNALLEIDRAKRGETNDDNE